MTKPACLPPSLPRPAASVKAVLLLCCTVMLMLPAFAAHAQKQETIEKSLSTQQKKAKQTEKKLNALTAQERALHKELAAAEDRMKQLERDLAKQESDLAAIERKREAAEKEHGQVLAQRRKTEQELRELLNAMWPLYMQSQAGRGGNVPDWHEADRQFEWSGRIYAAIDEKNRAIAEQEKSIAKALKTQEELARSARERLAAVNKTKDRLLRDRLQHNSKLQAVRKEKEDAEATLKNVLDVIKDLNYRMEETGGPEGEFAKMKGKLPWPARGRLAHKFAPNANPPNRGMALALSQGTEVRAVASGKVVHNDVLRGFGRVVIVMHDSAYYTLYAFLSESGLGVGQNIGRGQKLGTAGHFPRVEGPGLYFELRFHQKAINPEPWLTASN